MAAIGHACTANNRPNRRGWRAVAFESNPNPALGFHHMTDSKTVMIMSRSFYPLI